MYLIPNSISLPHVVALLDLNSDSSSPLERKLELWVTSSGKPMQRPLSWRGWKSRPWIQRLFGAGTWRISTVAHGVDVWTSSLRATRNPANRSALLADAVVSAIRGTCGPIYGELCLKYGRASVFSRTSGTTSSLDLIPLSATFENSDTAWTMTVESLRSDCLARRKWARRTGGSGFSSWPSPTARDNKNPDSPESRNYQRKVEEGWTIDPNSAASDWPTPRSADSHGAGYQRDRGTKGLERLSLTGQAREWPTPNTGDGTRGRQEPDGKRDPLLDTESRDFARSHQGRETTELGQRCLNGVPGSPQRSRLRRLNPYFVEWLMGWPIGWTAFGAVGTESFRSWRRRHLCVLQRSLSEEVARA